MVHLPARDIPVPTSVSPEAQAALALGRLGPPPREAPALDDVAGWKAYVSESDEFVKSMIGDPTVGYTGTIEERDIGPCPLYVLTPEGVRDDDRRVYFDIHGGAWVLGGGDLCKMTAISSATQLGTRTWSVDYRMPPDHPFPTPLDDCLAAYQLLLEERRPEEIIVGGRVGGREPGGRAGPARRDEGLPLPAAVVFNTGVFDLTGSGDSWQTNNGLDNLLDGSASASHRDLHRRSRPAGPARLTAVRRPPRLPTVDPAHRYTRHVAVGQRPHAPRAAGRRRRRRVARVGGRRSRRLPRHGTRGRRPLQRAPPLRRATLDRRHRDDRLGGDLRRRGARHVNSGTLTCSSVVGLPGLEPGTFGPPDRRANQAAPQPVPRLAPRRAV